MPDADFKEIGRMPVSDTTEVVLSEVYRDKELRGFTIGKYITTLTYTGFAKGAVYIPEDLLPDFLKLFPKDDLQLALPD